MAWYQMLVRSRKFWLAVLDAFVSTVTVLVTAWLSPENAKLVLTVVGIWQPVFVALIVGIAVEDAAYKRQQ